MELEYEIPSLPHAPLHPSLPSKDPEGEGHALGRLVTKSSPNSRYRQVPVLLIKWADELDELKTRLEVC